MLGKIFKRFRKIDDDIIIAHASPLAVPTLIGVVGDVHGCATLAAKLIDKLRDSHPDIKLLFVGDYIDRGEESRQVIELLMGMPEVTCLMRNHERMCLDFLAEPEERGGRWLRNGGLQTVASYGVTGSQTELTKMRDALALAMATKSSTGWPSGHSTQNLEIYMLSMLAPILRGRSKNREKSL